MLNDRRRLWPSIIALVLVAPFAALLVLSFVMPLSGAGGSGGGGTGDAALGGGGQVAAASSPASPAGGAGGEAGVVSATVVPAATEKAAAPENGPVLLAVGDGRAVWTAHGFTNESGGGGALGFELLWRNANAPAWQITGHPTDSGSGGNFWTDQGLPRALLLMEPGEGGKEQATPVVVGDGGYVDRYYEDHNAPLADLPRGQIVRAAAGGPGELFVITQGAPAAGANKAGDSLHAAAAAALGAPAPGVGAAPMAAGTESAPASASAPASQTAPASATASAPATATASATASAPATQGAGAAKMAAALNTYWFPPPSATGPATRPGKGGGADAADLWKPRPGDWMVLDPLPNGDGDGQSGPTASSALALAVRGDRLIAVWANPARPAELRLRTLDYTRRDAHWSEPIVSALPADEAVPAVTRLITVKMDGTIYVLWTVPTGASVALHGGWVETDPAAAEAQRYRLSTGHWVKAMSLGAAGQGISPATDVAAAASANSFLVVALKEGAISWMLFDNRGNPLSPAAPLEAHPNRPEGQVGQNVILFLMAMMMILSVWQWRRKAAPVTLPTGTVIAPVGLRLGALAVDALFAYVVVLVSFGAWENGGYFTLAESWFAALGRPEDLFATAPFPVFLGVYLAEATIGELFFRRSIGKAVTGLQVLMLDGKSPTVVAVLLRNLLRLPECVLAIGLLYMVLSDRRQRLGDLLARTLVVSQPGPETPGDPDDEAPRSEGRG